jgi:mRNA interferase MazF
VNLGDVYWVEFPSGAGRTQAGRRSAIILQETSITAVIPTILDVPLTTQQDALRFPGTVLVEPDEHNRLPRSSVALVFQLTAIDRRFFGNYLGQVADQTLAELWLVLDRLTGR